ncbi:MAG TPA: PfkB family carbohydrate kinase [Ktedonobacterales bacterium]
MTVRERLLALLERFAGKRALVLGDMVADEYIFGSPFRISREAPVLVLRRQGYQVTPGGALNPAVNARTLGAEVALAGVIGADEPGRLLRTQLSDLGVRMEGLITEPGRPTSSKTRILAGDTQLVRQQIVRIDQIDTSELEDETKQRIIAYLRETIPQVDMLLISDYEHGVINPDVLRTALPLALNAGKIVVADSHDDLARFQRVTALTPNQPEAEAMVGWKITDRATLNRAGERLLKLTRADAVLVTLGSQGMSLFTRFGEPFHQPASDHGPALDPTGAGDTVAATFMLALAASRDDSEDGDTRFRDAATLANLAGGLVVMQLGCATNTPADLAAVVNAQVKD